VAQLDWGQVAARYLRFYNPYQRGFPCVELFADGIERYFVFCADPITIVAVDQDVVPKDERVAAAARYEVFFKRRVCFLVERGQQAFEFFVYDNILHVHRSMSLFYAQFTTFTPVLIQIFHHKGRKGGLRPPCRVIPWDVGWGVTCANAAKRFAATSFLGDKPLFCRERFHAWD
jgi:hypothetical protein